MQCKNSAERGNNRPVSAETTKCKNNAESGNIWHLSADIGPKTGPWHGFSPIQGMLRRQMLVPEKNGGRKPNLSKTGFNRNGLGRGGCGKSTIPQVL